MQIGKTYISKTGAKRKPLFFSDCRRFIFVNCYYSNGTKYKKWYWVCHRLFID